MEKFNTIKEQTIGQFIDAIDLKKAIKNLTFIRERLLDKHKINEKDSTDYLEEYEKLWRIMDVLKDKKISIEEKQETYFYWFLITSTLNPKMIKSKREDIIEKINI